MVVGSPYFHLQLLSAYRIIEEQQGCGIRLGEPWSGGGGRPRLSSFCTFSYGNLYVFKEEGSRVTPQP